MIIQVGKRGGTGVLKKLLSVLALFLMFAVMLGVGAFCGRDTVDAAGTGGQEVTILRRIFL